MAVTFVAVQTMRGGNVAAATLAVQAAVTAYNATNNATHTATPFTVLPNNTKGMQHALTLWAQLARLHGCTLVRLAVHGGACMLVGPQDAITATQAAYTPAYNAAVTAAAAAYNPATHGPRAAFTNGYTCGSAAALYRTPATLAYGVGMLHTFTAPGNGSAYAIGYAATPEATPASTPAAPKAAPKAATKATKAA